MSRLPLSKKLMYRFAQLCTASVAIGTWFEAACL